MSKLNNWELFEKKTLSMGNVEMVFMKAPDNLYQRLSYTEYSIDAEGVMDETILCPSCGDNMDEDSNPMRNGCMNPDCYMDAMFSEAYVKQLIDSGYEVIEE